MRIPALASLAAAALLLACAESLSAQVDRPAGESSAALSSRRGTLLTREELIASGSANVYDAVRRLRRDWLRFNSSRSRFPAVYIDGEYAGEPDVLREHAVDEVLWVQFSDRREARVRFPSVFDAGAIHLSTTLPLSSVHGPVPRPEVWEGRAMGRNDYVGDAPNAAGIGAGFELPVRQNVLVTGSATHGRLERSCPCPESAGTAEVQVTTAGLGLKLRGASGEVYAPYVVLGVEALNARWEPVVIGEGLPEGGTDWGYGGTGGLGLDMRLASRFLVFAQGDVSFARFPGDWAGPTRSFRLGTTLLLGAQP
jgi:hypothetical protein